jgi:hypothetical protein
MRPDRDPGLTVESTVTGEEVQMGIAKNALTHIMGILTDMYPVPVVAVIREYATNAWDSHVAAGNTDTPIEVTLPSALAPVYQVRDFGVGLDADDIRTIYSQYGASTKRDSDGSKSALAHTDQFTFTGIKDGIKTVASVSRDEAGIATMMIVSETPTDEPQGVLVSVPANGKEAEFEEHARDFFKYWDPNHVVINGRPPEKVDGYKLSDSMLLEDWTDPDPYGYGRRRGRGSGDQRHIVVMGNVPYPVPEDSGFESLKIPNNRRLVTWVPIGSVHFTPARDSLQDTKRTKETLKRIQGDYVHLQHTSLQRNLDATKQRTKVLELLLEASKTFPQQSWDNLTWQGKPIPQAGFGKSRATSPSYRSKYALTSEEETSLIEIARAPVVVYNFTNETWSGSMLAKLKAYIEDKGKTLEYREARSYYDTGSGTRILLFREKPKQHEWIPFMVDWKAVRKWQPDGGAAKGGVTKKILGSYEVKKAGDWRANEMTGDEIIAVQKSGTPVVWTRGGKYASNGHMNSFWDQHPQGLVVTLTENRVAKFERDFPTVSNVRKYVGRKYVDWWNGLKPLDRAALRSTFPYNMTVALKLKNIEDPLLKRALQLYRRYSTLRRSFSRAEPFLSDELRAKRPSKAFTPSESRMLERKYPLIFNSTASTEHLQWYAECVQRKDGT